MGTYDLGIQSAKPAAPSESRLWSTLWSEVHSMATVQVVLDPKLLKAADEAARRLKKNRSALVRDALSAYLHALEIRTKEEQERAGYARIPEDLEEARFWEAEAVWPNE
ncbi:MAG: ribbon-helix-helix protein, CopG family [Terracidiphilus sp.]